MGLPLFPPHKPPMPSYFYLKNIMKVNQRGPAKPNVDMRGRVHEIEFLRLLQRPPAMLKFSIQQQCTQGRLMRSIKPPPPTAPPNSINLQSIYQVLVKLRYIWRSRRDEILGEFVMTSRLVLLAPFESSRLDKTTLHNDEKHHKTPPRQHLSARGYHSGVFILRCSIAFLPDATIRLHCSEQQGQ